MVAWQSREEDGTGVYSRLHGERFSWLGSPLGDEFLIGATGGTINEVDVVAQRLSARTVVSWHRTVFEGSQMDHDLVARLLDGTGSFVDDMFVVTDKQLAVHQAACPFADGSFLIFWEGNYPGGRGIFAQRFDADGNKLYH